MNPEMMHLVEMALAEDIGTGDITTQAVFSGSEIAKADLVAKEDGVLAGLELIKAIYAKAHPDITLKTVFKDGNIVRIGDILATVKGPANVLLTTERVILNFLQRMSGIATKTRKFCDEISHTKAKILDTRKTVPGHRYLDKLAVKLGGGENHRIGLYDRYLIKENHIAVAGGVLEAIQKCSIHRKKNKLKASIEIEINNLDQLKLVMTTDDVSVVMLDNMINRDIKKAVALVNDRLKLEASGNVTILNVRSIAETGVDYISIGNLTHSVQALDISMLFR